MTQLGVFIVFPLILLWPGLPLGFPQTLNYGGPGNGSVDRQRYQRPKYQEHRQHQQYGGDGESVGEEIEHAAHHIPRQRAEYQAHSQ